MLFENLSSSPNYNIAMIIASELRKTNDVFIGYYSEGKITTTGGFRDEFSIKETGYYSEYTKVKAEPARRIGYLLSHPLFLGALIRFHTGLMKSINYWDMLKGVDRYCFKNHIDMAVSITEPYFLSMIVSDLRNVKIRKCVQLDPHAYNHYFVKDDRKLFLEWLKEERKVFGSINKLYTTKLIKDDLIKNDTFNNDKNRIVEIEFPLIKPKDVSPCSGENTMIINKKEDEVSFLHAGVFYEDIRNAGRLVELFRLLPENYILYVAGRNSSDIDKYTEGMEDRIRDLGLLSRQEVDTAACESDFLISYNNTLNNQVPSKLFDCINSGKPFINLCQVENCPTLPYVEGFDMAFTLYSFDMKASVDSLISFVNEKKGTITDRRYVLDRYYNCTVEYVSRQIMK